HHSPGPDFQIGQQAFDEDPDDGDRDEDLPPESHDLVVSIARKRRAKPQEAEQEDEKLQEQPLESVADDQRKEPAYVGGLPHGFDIHETAERTQPAAEEEDRGQRRDQDHVGVLGQEEQRERDARILDVETG